MVIIMVVVIGTVSVATNMNPSVEMFSLTPHQSRPDLRFDGKTSALIQAPLQGRTDHTVDGVVLWLTIQVVLQSSMPLNRDNRSNPELARIQFFSTCSAMGPDRQW